MGQKLILPINKCKLTASMKTDAYQKKFGFVHYGVDLVSTAGDRTLYASGDGTVVGAGRDNVVGNVVAVCYPAAVNRSTGKVQDVVFRYFHLENIAVKSGQKVNKDTVLGKYGNTGSVNMANHLHLEADTDTAHPLYSPTVAKSNLLKGRSEGAHDGTMSSALHWLHAKADAPDYQTYTTAGDAYTTQADKAMAQIREKTETSSGALQIQGIDVSRHNGVVDWSKVKAAGKSFVFVRVGWAGWDGKIAANNGLDARFHENMKGASAAGLQVGVYVYSYVKTPEAAAVAARETLELAKPYKPAYPIAFDIEDTTDSGTRYDKMSRDENAAIAKAFLSEVEKAGYRPLLYTYKSFAESYLNMAALSGYDVWIAHYAKVSGYAGSHTIWQYMGDVEGFVGSCPGVNGPCDLNVCYKDYAAQPLKPEPPPPQGGGQPQVAVLQEENQKLKEENRALKKESDLLKEDLASLVQKHNIPESR